MVRVRVAAMIAVVGPLMAAAASLALGPLDPGYDPIRTSVSRLAAKGAPGAALMDGAIAILGISLLALAVGVWWTWAMAKRPVAGLVAVAAVCFLIASAVQIDPASPPTVAGHRAASGVALASLVLAAFAAARTRSRDASGDWYARACLVLGMVALAVLVSGVGLLVDGFPGGVWERTLAVLTLGWVELTAVRLLIPPSGREPAERRRPARPAEPPRQKETGAGPRPG